MKEKHCIRINVADLVNEDIKLHLKYQEKSDFDENAIVWQQMTCENFNKFLKSGALCFKQLSKYSKSDERKLSFYEQNYLENVKDNRKRSLIEKRNLNFEKIVYISCWYISEFLTDLPFKEYAKEDGVAIGIKIKDLIQTIEQNSDKLAPYEEIYYGKTAYLNSQYKVVTDCEEAIAPLFLKETSKQSDNEFRFAYVKDSLWHSDVNGMRLLEDPEELCFINIGKAEDIIQYIAVKEEHSLFKFLIERYELNISKSPKQMDGFIVYEKNDREWR